MLMKIPWVSKKYNGKYLIISNYTITTSRPARYFSKRIAWLDDSAYQEVLDYFTVPPTIRVALSDPTQDIVPIFSGDVIFLATEVHGYWQIVLQNGQEPLYFSQDAVPSDHNHYKMNIVVRKLYFM